jgi:hypothetical protein
LIWSIAKPKLSSTELNVNFGRAFTKESPSDSLYYLPKVDRGVLILNMIPISIFNNLVRYVELDFNLAHHTLGTDFVIKGLDCKKFWDQV